MQYPPQAPLPHTTTTTVPSFVGHSLPHTGGNVTTLLLLGFWLLSAGLLIVAWHRGRR